MSFFHTILRRTLPLTLAAASLLPAAWAAKPTISNRQTLPPDGVYRIFFGSRPQLDQIARRFVPLEVNHKDGTALLELSSEQATELQTQGFFLEHDADKTAAILMGPPGYTCYRNVTQIYDAMNGYATQYPNLASVENYGSSWRKIKGYSDGYDLKALCLTNRNITGTKPRFLVVAATHAREISTCETALYFANQLLSGYGTNADATWILDNEEVWIVPVMNPDGRALVEQGCMQRKNLNNTKGTCTQCDTYGSSHYGVDLNRNCPTGWGGASTSACDAAYQGTAANSEPENQALLNKIRALFPDQRANDTTSPAPSTTTGLVISLHSYSDLVLWPWGYTTNNAPNNTELATLGRRLAYFNNYTPEKITELYAATGGLDDTVYGELGVPCFTIELGSDFFENCSNLPTLEQTNAAALLYGAKVCRTPYQLPGGPDVLNPAVSSGTVTAGTSVTLTATVDDTHFNQSNGTEPTQNIAEAQYTVDVPFWATGAAPLAMTAQDGQFNSKTENVRATVNTSALAAGRHTFYLRGKDASGAWGPVSAVFLTVQGPAVIAGDLDGNGQVQAADLVVMDNYLTGKLGTIPAGTTAADLNSDGSVDAVDLNLLLARLQ